jgi:hypothetical protein
VVALTVALGIGLAAAPGDTAPVAVHGQPGEPTIAIPTPLPRPVYVPLLQQTYDPRYPDPIVSTIRGHLDTLEPAGRERCAPATHVLLDRAPGPVVSQALAVLVPADRADPALNLDLYVGGYVEIDGLVYEAPASCRGVTWQLIAVTAIREVDRPPGAR